MSVKMIDDKRERDILMAGLRAIKQMPSNDLADSTIKVEEADRLAQKIVAASACPHYAVMAASIRHLSPIDCEVLNEKAAESPLVMENLDGYFIRIGSNETETVRQSLDRRYSGALQGLILFAVGNGFEMIELRYDAPVLPGHTIQIDEPSRHGKG